MMMMRGLMMSEGVCVVCVRGRAFGVVVVVCLCLCVAKSVCFRVFPLGEETKKRTLFTTHTHAQHSSRLPTHPHHLAPNQPPTPAPHTTPHKLKKKTHETIAIAMNRIGGKSNSGEGGEDPVRWREVNDVPDGGEEGGGVSATFPYLRGLANGDLATSRIKQVASGRFGVTPQFLVNADQLEIKVGRVVVCWGVGVRVCARWGREGGRQGGGARRRRRRPDLRLAADRRSP